MNKKEIIDIIRQQKFGLIDISNNGEVVTIDCGEFNIYFYLECNGDIDNVVCISVYLSFDEGDTRVFEELFEDINSESVNAIIDWVQEKKVTLFEDLKKLNKCIFILNEISLSTDFIIDYIERNIELDN